MPSYHLHADFENVARTRGGIEMPLPPNIRAEFAQRGLPVPLLPNLGAVVVTPPHVDDGDSLDGHPHCGHCGTVVAPDERLKLHAVAGFEFLRHPATDEPLRLLIRHCASCADGLACSPTMQTPGSGHGEGIPAGWCEPWAGQSAVTASAFIIPVPSSVLQRLSWQLRRWGYRIEDFIWKIATSQGQQIATLTGTTGAIGVQDSTSGHGYNAGALRIYTGSAPATANAAATGTKLVDQAFPNPMFGAASAALPSVLTANAISNSTILATGTAGYARMFANGDDDALSTTERRMQLTVGTSATEVVLNTTSLVSGGTFSTTSLTVTHGA